MDKFRSLFGAAILTLASLPVNAALLTYTDRTVWEDAFKAGPFSGAIKTETFASSISNAETIVFDESLISSTATTLDVNRVQGNKYQGRLQDPNTITWAFPKPVLGFFGDFYSVQTLFGTVANHPTFEIAPNNSVKGGFGVLFDFNDPIPLDPFSQVMWSSAESEAFMIGDFDYIESAPVSAVPVPAALWLFGTGLLGLIGFSRRSKAV